MTKKILIVVVVFYLLGVFSVAGGYLSSEWGGEWGGEWSFSAQRIEAVKIGAAWPLLIIEQIMGV